MIIFTILLLVLMEVSLSFDNAVLNASILQRMEPITGMMGMSFIGLSLWSSVTHNKKGE